MLVTVPNPASATTPSVGLVVVSHSRRLAEGVVEVARAMADPALRIEGVGGAAGRLGADATAVMAALERARGPGGVVVLTDLGSTLLAAETALDLLGWTVGDAVVSSAPLVEGAVAAAVAASSGADLARVAAEARTALLAKQVHLGEEVGRGDRLADAGEEEGGQRPAAAPASSLGPSTSWRFTMELPHGLHARPAARLVRATAGLAATTELSDATTGAGPASTSSLSRLVALGIGEGHEVVVKTQGPAADEALRAVQALVAERFGEAAAEADHRPVALLDAGPFPGSESGSPEHQVHGLPACAGVVSGPLRRLVVETVWVPPAHIDLTGGVTEWQVLASAVEGAKEALARRQTDLEAQGMGEAGRLVEVQRLLLEDEAVLEGARAALASGQSPAQAWQRATEEAAARWERLDDPYLAARAGDLRAAANAVLERLGGVSTRRVRPLEGPGVVLGAGLDPATLAQLDQAAMLGLAIVGGSPTDHLAVMARSLGIPTVVGLPAAALELPEAVVVGLDGEAGLLEVDPSPERLRRYRPAGTFSQGGRRSEVDGDPSPAVSADGRVVNVLANVATVAEAIRAVRAGADGVGLLRSELAFAAWDRAPSEDEHFTLYAEIAGVLVDRPLVIRTFDVGADKPLSFVPVAAEPNPALGMRGLRLALARPELLSTQMRAIQRLANERPVKVMLPMVTTAEELTAARRLLEQAGQEVGTGLLGSGAELGIMIEVPAAAIGAGALAGDAAFFSIGTNDLCQYVMAADRLNPAVATLADGLAPAVLRLVGAATRAARARGRSVAVCGELAADRLAVPLLMGLGVDELSVRPSAIAPVKAMIRNLDVGRAEAVVAEALELTAAAQVRELVRAAFH